MANTYNFSSVVETALHTATKIMQSKLEAFAGFATSLVYDSEDQRKFGIEMPHATAAATTQTDPSVFNSGDSTIDARALTPVLHVQPFGTSNSDINSGLRFEHILQINTVAFCEKLTDTMLTPITTTNYGAAAVTVAASSFSMGDFDQLLAALPAADRVVLLSPEYFNRVKVIWLPPRFNSVYELSRWSSAGTNVKGFVADRAALAFVSGIPMDEVWATMSRKVITLPDVGISATLSYWLDTNTRSLRWTLSSYLSAVAADKAALKLLTSA